MTTVILASWLHGLFAAQIRSSQPWDWATFWRLAQASPSVRVFLSIFSGLLLLGLLGRVVGGWKVHWARLHRFYGYRKWFALLWAAIGASAARWITLYVWARGQGFWDTTVLERAVWLIVVGLWWRTMLAPVLGIGFHAERNYRCLCNLGLIGLGSVFALSLGNSSGVNTLWLPRPEVFVKTTLLPLAAGVLIVFYQEAREWWSAQPTIRRHCLSEGDCAGWMGPRGMRRFVRHWPTKVLAKAGRWTSDLIMGLTTFESYFWPRRIVALNESSHLCTVAMTGAGKKLAIGPVMTTLNSSIISVTVKGDHADEFLGRRVDPALFEAPNPAFRHLGVDPRGITQVKRHLPNGRAFLLDLSGQTRYAERASFHNILSELDLNDKYVTALVDAIATASFPDQPGQRDRFWTIGPRGFYASAIAHVITADPDPLHHTLPFVADFCMGVDPNHRRADPKVFEKNLLAMLKNPALGGYVQRGAANIAEQLGSNAYGSLRSEFENSTRWLAAPWIRTHLNQPSQFSYRELGDRAAPVTVFLVPPRGEAALQTALPWLRTHVELALQILQNTMRTRTDSVLVIADEIRHYGGEVAAIKNGLTILRDARVKLWLLVQSWPSLELIIGKDAAAEVESSATLQFFGCNDIETKRYL